MRTTTWLTAAAVLAFAARAPADDKTGLDDDGFIQNWLVLAPIPRVAGDGGPQALVRAYLKDEGKLKPKADAKVKVGGKEFTWKRHSAKEHLVDFNAVAGATTEDSVAFAASYVVAPKELKGVLLKIGSDDQAAVILNGREVMRQLKDRGAEKDQDAVAVTLKKGVNVLVAKVVNGKADWAFCARFTDKNDVPVKGLVAKMEE